MTNLRALALRVLTGSCAAVVLLAFSAIFFDVLLRGVGRLDAQFLVELPTDAGRGGGIASILVSTSLILMVCIAVSAPLGLASAAYLSELTRRNSRIRRWTQRGLDALAAVPSIIFGMFGSVVFCDVLQLGFSILSGGLTLACMILPIVIRVSEAGFSSVDPEQRAAAAALGLGPVTTFRQIVIPRALPAIGASFVLGVGRALAETAALVFTSGYVARMPESLLDSGRAISVHILDLAVNVPGGAESAYSSALVLMLALATIQLVASQLGRRILARSLS